MSDDPAGNDLPPYPEVPLPRDDGSTCVLLLVVGATLRAEMADRPLIYSLQARIIRWLERRQSELAIRVVPLVCTDIWYLNEEALQARPTISVGGPGVNAVSAHYAKRIAPSILRDNRIVIQLDPDFVDLRACVWGMDNVQTIEALRLFEQEYLDPFLRAVATQVEPDLG